MIRPRAGRRRLERLQAEVDRILEGDSRFFSRHPGRNHRLRLAGQAEINMLAEVQHGPGKVKLPAGERWYCVVRQIAPGCQVRHFTTNREGIETDLSETYGRALFDHLAPAGSATAYAEEVVRTLAKHAGAQP